MQETQETWVRSLDQEDPLEDLGDHSNILTWRISWIEEFGGLQSMGSQRVGHDWSDWAHTHAYSQLIFDEGVKNTQWEKSLQ